MENLPPPLRVALLFLSIAFCSGAFAAPQPGQSLLDLAKEKFAPRVLTDAEEMLFKATEKGEEAKMLPGTDEGDDPASAGAWTENRIVYASSLEWLCSDAEALALVTHRGI